MYVAVKGGERAIANAPLPSGQRAPLGDSDVPEMSVAQIREQLALPSIG